MMSAVVGVIAIAVPIRIRLTCKAPLTEKIARSEHRHDRLVAGLTEDAKPYVTLLNVQDTSLSPAIPGAEMCCLPWNVHPAY